MIISFSLGINYAQMKAGNAELSSQDSTLDLARFDSLNYNKLKSLKVDDSNYDSSVVDIRSIDSTKIYAYLKDKDFKYFEDPEYSTTLLERILDWLKRFLAKLFSFDPKGITGDLINYLLIAFAFIAIIYVIYRKEIKGLFTNNKNIDPLKSFERIEDIHSIDYEKLIEQAIENKNYRYAIRLNYLRTLKFLSDKELINWKPDKTNHEYINEIKHSNLKPSFENLTNDFELIWYGERGIDFSNYSILSEIYKNFRSTLEKNHK